MVLLKSSGVLAGCKRPQVVPSLPRRSDVSHQSVCDTSCGLRPHPRGSASGTRILTRLLLSSLTLRPEDLLTIQKMALSVRFIRFVSSTDGTLATGR